MNRVIYAGGTATTHCPKLIQMEMVVQHPS